MIFSTLDFTSPGVAQTYSFMQPKALAYTDVLIWSPGGLLPSLETQLETREPAVLKPAASEVLLAASRHWRLQFRQLLAAGGTLVVLLDPAVTVGIHTLQEVMDYQWNEPLLPLDIQTETYHSKLPALNHVGEPFRSLFEQTGQLFAPSARLKHAPGTHILIDAAGATLAAYLSLPPGRILWLPKVDHDGLASNEGSATFIRALAHCISRLGQQAGIQLSRWLDDLASPAAQTLQHKRVACLQQRRRLDEQISQLERDIAQQDFFRQIAAGESMGTMPAVAEAFRRQGVYVHNDWLTHDLFIAEMPDFNLMLKIRLANEAWNDTAWNRLSRAQARIQEYFGKPTRSLIVDCAENNLPPAQRRHVIPRELSERLPGALLIHSLHFFGWHAEAEPCSPATLLEALQNGDTPFLQKLSATALEHLGLLEPAPHT